MVLKTGQQGLGYYTDVPLLERWTQSQQDVKDDIALSIQAEKDGNNQCYGDYVDPNITKTDFTSTFEQNEILGLYDMKTEKNQHPDTGSSNQFTTASEGPQCYGTDMEELSGHICRGPDHPHAAGKVPVEKYTTVMGPGSVNFAVPTITQRGKKIVTLDSNTNSATKDESNVPLQEIVSTAENEDTKFRAKSDDNVISEGVVLKTGQQGFGYYTDIPLLERW